MAAVGLASGCGGSGKSGESATMQREANLYEIDQIEVEWHQRDLAPRHQPDDVAVGAGCRLQHRPPDAHGQGADPALVPDGEQGVHAEHHWESDTPAYKIRIDLNGDKATLYFECHYIDPKTRKVVAVGGRRPHAPEDQRQWLIVELGRSDRHASP